MYIVLKNLESRNQFNFEIIEEIEKMLKLKTSILCN